jgi:hypothetical protein
METGAMPNAPAPPAALVQPAAPPIAKRRRRWPLFAIALVLLAAGAYAAPGSPLRSLPWRAWLEALLRFVH